MRFLVLQPCIPMDHPAKVELKAQLIEKKYVDQKKMVRALRNRFSEPDGTRNFKIQVCAIVDGVRKRSGH